MAGTNRTPRSSRVVCGGWLRRLSTLAVPMALALWAARCGREPFTSLNPISVVVTRLTTGTLHTCALTTAGTAYCWGDNDDGALGDGTTTSRSTPVSVAGGLAFAALSAADYHTCGLTGSGAAYCWGLNHSGELGDGTTTDHWTPMAVAGGLTFRALSAGGTHGLGRTPGGGTYTLVYAHTCGHGALAGAFAGPFLASVIGAARIGTGYRPSFDVTYAMTH